VGIVAIIQEALRIGRARKSLWLFGFFVGVGGGSGSGGGGGQAPLPGPAPGSALEPGLVLLWVLLGLGLVVGFVILKFVSTGALIEGVTRARRNVAMTVREGFAEGWAHWGVLLRITLLYLAASVASVAVLAAVPFLAGEPLGRLAMFVAGGVAVVVGVPWLVTLYIWQAFAERIAVLENRHALDAIRKARLFLHGRLRFGLKLLVAAFLGALAVLVLGMLVIVPMAALIFGAAWLWGSVFAGVALGALTLVPVLFVVIAMVGIMTSSVWTIGYLTQVEA
jgi:hypothetical protein